MGKNVPVGVQVISIWYYVSAAIALVLSILLFTGSAYIGTLFSNIPILSILGAVGAGLLIFAGIVSLLAAVFCFFIGRGLWKTKNWARILVIVFSCLGIFSGLFGLSKPSVMGIVMLLINLAIGGYLIFSKEAKGAFK